MFDLSKPHARAYPSSFGGGWIVPDTDEGRAFLTDWFGAEPGPLAPVGMAEGWIVEPHQGLDLAEALRAAGLAWEVRQ